MCCIFFTLGSHGHHLILASNRDEWLHRPTCSAAFHNFPPLDSFSPSSPSSSSSSVSPSHIFPTPTSHHSILSGIDADPSGGGTWLGINSSTGKWAALTNFTEDRPPPLPLKGKPHVLKYRSRGGLVRSWLKADSASMDQYLDMISQQRDEYAGFNLLVGQVPVEGKKARVAYATNRDPTQRQGADVVQGLPGEIRFLLPESQPHDGEEASQSLQGNGIICSICEPSPFTSHEEAHLASQDPQIESSPLETPFHGCPSVGLSNSVLSEPWSKVKTGRAGFDRVLKHYSSINTKTNTTLPEAEQKETLLEGLFDILSTPTLENVQARSDLQRTVLVPAFQATPPSRHKHNHNHNNAKEKEKGEIPTSGGKSWYGTRTSTILLVDQDGKVLFVERDVHVLHDGSARLLSLAERKRGERRFEFTLGEV